MLCHLQSEGFLSSCFQKLSKLLTAERKLHCYSLEEVNRHDNYSDCWIILLDNIFDITEFIKHHPGGETVLLENAGRDATFVFLSAGHGEEMMAILSKYLVGFLPDHQKLFVNQQTQQ